ncbi:UPF0149 family protein [Legionella londiniensis]|uniref:YecA family protein n=1 Tax=Legionella londiniensis TaxID=45068 RepID=A0A0W0VPS8_9GAMM|nr:YecA family protein [Legionella londiniensis]KTD21785.1 hypothetical protein Llon_0950 [Legionella londiniensis]STX92161.1 Putative conserved exported protein precursor [Legionella londiniensis]
MSTNNQDLEFPDYHAFCESIAPLSLPVSGSEIHGILCSYLCAGEIQKGEAYLQSLVSPALGSGNKHAFLALFNIFSVSYQQIVSLDFGFQLLIPGDEASLVERAQAFSEWCEGFTRGLLACGIGLDNYQEEEAQNAAAHLAEFAKLDYESIQLGEGDEFAFMEVSEYARMAVLRIYSDLNDQGITQKNREKTH